MGLSTNELDPPLDDIAFLARSNHRVRVLEELAADERTRRELHEKTGISQPTLGRVLDGFQEREWVRENGHTYTLTPFGRLLVDEFEDLMETAETIQQLRDLAPRLPLDELDFDIRLLAEATITTPSSTDSSAHFRREEVLLDRTEQVRFLCHEAYPPTVRKYRNQVVEEGLSLEGIIAGDAIDAASTDASMQPHLRDLLESDRVTLYRYDGPISVMLGSLDDVASIVPLDDAGVPCAFIEIENGSVREAIAATLDSYREQSKEVTADTLSK